MLNKIKESREYFGLSQRELAKKIGICSSEMSYIEAGLRIPNVFIALDIAHALNTTVEKLFREDEYENE